MPKRPTYIPPRRPAGWTPPSAARSAERWGARTTAMKEHGATRMQKGSPLGKLAWWYMTPQEKDEYASWRSSPGAGAFAVGGGEGVLPRNWRILDQGSVPEVAVEDVGAVGIDFIAMARDAMKNELPRIVRDWATARRNKLAEDARVS